MLSSKKLSHSFCFPSYYYQPWSDFHHVSFCLFWKPPNLHACCQILQILFSVYIPQFQHLKHKSDSILLFCYFQWLSIFQWIKSKFLKVASQALSTNLLSFILQHSISRFMLQLHSIAYIPHPEEPRHPSLSCLYWCHPFLRLPSSAYSCSLSINLPCKLSMKHPQRL